MNATGINPSLIYTDLYKNKRIESMQLDQIYSTVIESRTLHCLGWVKEDLAGEKKQSWSKFQLPSY